MNQLASAPWDFVDLLRYLIEIAAGGLPARLELRPDAAVIGPAPLPGC